MKVEEKRGGLAARAIVFSKPCCGKRAKPYGSAGASKRLAPCKLHAKSLAIRKTVNFSPLVVNTPEPAVYICTIIPFYINSVVPNVCANQLLICNLSMVLS